MLKTYWLFISIRNEGFDGGRWLLETKEHVLECVKEALDQGQTFRVCEMKMTEEEFEKVPEM